MGINAMVVAISAAAGPSVASGILSVASWHWLFAINVPLGLVALTLGLKYLPRKEERSNRQFDKLECHSQCNHLRTPDLYFGWICPPRKQ